MKFQYVTTPVAQFITKQKTPSMKRARTIIKCPECNLPFSKREFESHVLKKHPNKVDKIFATLFGVPTECACGKELHYNKTVKGFPTACATCAELFEENSCKTAEDCRNRMKELQKMMNSTKAQERKLRKEEELLSVPLEKLPFPSFKYVTFLRKLTMAIRVNTVNFDKQKLFELANFIDSKIKTIKIPGSKK